MSDNISIVLKTILSNDKKDIEAQIRQLSSQIKERLELKLKIDASDLQLLTKQAEEVTKKLKMKTVVKGSQFINTKVEHQAFNEITSRIREVRKNVDQLAKVDIAANKKGQMTGATLTYYNKELGQTVRETMGWSESQKKVNGELIKFKTFGTLGFKYSDDMAKAARETEKTSQALKELNLYRQKMLGGNGFAGDIDIFASKQKGRFDESALSKIRLDVQSLTKDTPDLQNKMKQLGIQFSSLKNQAAQSGNVMVNALENAGKFLRFYLVGGILVGFVGTIRNAIKDIYDLDTAITDLKKVSDEIGKSVGVKEFLSDINEMAIEVGHSTKAAIESISEFKRLGYSLNEAKKLAEQSLVYSNISDQSIEDSTKSIISTLKGFQLGVEDVNHVMDAYNEVGNNFQISSAGIGSALQRSSAALFEANNTMEESIGLIVAANSSIQNPEKVGNG